MKRVALFVLLAVLIVALCPAGAVFANPKALETVDYAWEYLQYIDENFPDRDAGTEGEKKLADELRKELEWIGYTEENSFVQEFAFTDNEGAEKSSQNIVAIKPGEKEEIIVIGAHYDNESEGTGAHDNTSGTALVLGAAASFFEKETPYTLHFVFFGAGEAESAGAEAYVAAMGENKDKIVLMINIDGILAGDHCYLYGGIPHPEKEEVYNDWAVDQAYSLGRALGLDLRLHPYTFDNPEPGAKKPAYPSPSVGEWSEHLFFSREGIAYLYFEATNWEIAPYDGSAETADQGTIGDTEKDTLAYIEEHFPDRAWNNLETYGTLLDNYLVEDIQTAAKESSGMNAGRNSMFATLVVFAVIAGILAFRKKQQQEAEERRKHELERLFREEEEQRRREEQAKLEAEYEDYDWDYDDEAYESDEESAEKEEE
ncbi:MAG: M28 family peptidase [Clostridiales bacterium]|nr:M28 family peptidase [Clostridiales bacterium]